MKRRLLTACLIAMVSVSQIQTASAQQNKDVSAWPRGITYEIFVQSFADSNGDGIGDINGMTAKLDYLKDLGVGGIWVMPMNPSPSEHKYDVLNYYDIDPHYGTLADFKRFVAEAHKRNIKVVMDMVFNHSSNRNPWFLDAKSNVNSPYRDYYVWTNEDDPQVQEAGNVTAGESKQRNHWVKAEGTNYRYYAQFGRNMPDLNYDSPKLREEAFKIGKFWLSEADVDGFRLDAARHIFPDNRADDNHWWWIYFHHEMQKVKKDVYLVGEVWAPANVVGPYLKGLTSSFNFDLAGEIIKAVKNETADTLAIHHKKIEDYYKNINPYYVDATFLTNHDQVRIMSEVNDNEDKARMAAALLLTLPGSPYLYYGEEIGMRGKKPDPNIREPFLWDVKSKDKSRTTWEPSIFSTDSTITPAVQQLTDKRSLLNFYKEFIKLRNDSKALTYGEMEPQNLGNAALCAFTRTTVNESLLVVHNLSKVAIILTLPQPLISYSAIILKTKEANIQNHILKIPAYSTVILKN